MINVQKQLTLNFILHQAFAVFSYVISDFFPRFCVGFATFLKLNENHDVIFSLAIVEPKTTSLQSVSQFIQLCSSLRFIANLGGQTNRRTEGRHNRARLAHCRILTSFFDILEKFCKILKILKNLGKS